MRKIILASGSPRRKQILEWAEVQFDILTKDTDETFTENSAPESAAMQIALRKAVEVKQMIRDHQFSSEVFPMEKRDKITILNKIKTSKEIPPILSADTIVVINDKILGKPTDKIEATTMLNQLSGKTHQVITGVCISYKNDEIVFSDTTEVEFHHLTKEHIEFYLDKYKPYDKAGGYAIQEWIGVTGIKSIKGDFYNVMGLPVSRVLKILDQLPD
ncbi:MAG: Maf family protein [Ginsengibacter sp.]